MKDKGESNYGFRQSISRWLSFKGRINKQTFWLYYVLPFVLIAILPIPFFLSLFSIWILLAGTVKRLHDSDVSGKALMLFVILWIVVVVLSSVVAFIFFMGGISGAGDKDMIENAGFIMGIPILAILILPIYAGLKPSSPDENKYGPPTAETLSPTPSVVSKENKKVIGKGVILFIVVSLSIIIGFVAIRWIQHIMNQKTWNPALIYAIKDGKNAGEIRALLENGEDPNQRTEYGTTALMLTLDQRPSDQSDILAVLLEYGADPNISCLLPNGLIEQSPLNIAIEVGHTDIAKLLLDYGADPNLLENELALSETLRNNRIDISQLLLDHGADPNSDVNDNVLITVAEQGSIDAVKLLLTYGVNLEQISAAKQWVENELSKKNAPNDLKTSKRLLEMQRLLIEVENKMGS